MTSQLSALRSSVGHKLTAVPSSRFLDDSEAHMRCDIMTPQEDHELACSADPCAPDAVATWRRGAARHAKGHDYAPCTAEMSQLVAEARAALGDAARVERQLLAGGEEGLTEPQLRRWVGCGPRARCLGPLRAELGRARGCSSIFFDCCVGLVKTDRAHAGAHAPLQAPACCSRECLACWRILAPQLLQDARHRSCVCTTNTRAHACAQARAHTHVPTCVCSYTNTHPQMHTRTYAHTHTHTHTHSFKNDTCTHTNTHTHTKLRRWLRARGWDPARAARDLAAHAAWRAQFAPLGRVQESEVAREIAQGKVFLQVGGGLALGQGAGALVGCPTACGAGPPPSSRCLPLQGCAPLS